MDEKSAQKPEVPAVETRPEGCGTTSVLVTADCHSMVTRSGSTIVYSTSHVWGLHQGQNFFLLSATKRVLERRLLLLHLFGDWTPAANNIFLSVIAVKKKKNPEGNLKSQEMEMNGWTLWDCYRQLWFSELCWAAALLAWEIHYKMIFRNHK